MFKTGVLRRELGQKIVSLNSTRLPKRRSLNENVQLYSFFCFVLYLIWKITVKYRNAVKFRIR